MVGKEMCRKRIKRSRGDYVLDLSINFFLILLTMVTVYPIYYIVCASFSSGTALIARPGILLKPEGFNLGAYGLAFRHPLLLSGYRNILIILACALPLNFMTLMAGYFMACRNMMFKKAIVSLMLFTMFFGGGLIPGYLNQRSLGLYDNLAALIIPSALSMYNAIICKTAIEAIPDSLKESAYIDGANDFQILLRVVMPLIKPTIAVLLLYYGVAHWNSWFPASIYIRRNERLPLQNILRALLIANSDLYGSLAQGDKFDNYAETIKYAVIVISTAPIICIYPFLQKYFVKGVMVGAVKG